MKEKFVLVYVNGYGEKGCKTISAYSLREAHTIAKNFCTQQMIHKAKIITKAGQKFTV
jgi:hypothetical protein